ncbi:MAG: hypothetical protein HDR89_09185 [Bacteroides sp.]|nr:hypothetical protein [Bacteroides sp.]
MIDKREHNFRVCIYKGKAIDNQLIGLSEIAPTVLLENSLDMPQGHWPSGFYYDRNGNMVSDPSRGIFAIYYNPLNLPTGITMQSGARFDYLYSAAGTKLAEIIYEPGADTPTVRRDYAGIFEFENSSLARISLASGYITPSVKLIPINSDSESPTQNVGTHPGASAPEAEDTANSTLIPNPGFPLIPTTPTLDLTATYHLYAFDHQGNVIGVYNTKTATLEQTTDYYPYGLPHATATYHSDCNRRLYSAKELTTEAGLNAYDFAARWQSPALPRFTTPDPLAEQYTPIGPQVFCGGDPINLIDPSGCNPIYDQYGYLLGTTLEGFCGEIYVYTGDKDDIDFSKMSIDNAISELGEDINTLDHFRNNGLLNHQAYQNIWNDILQHFDGLRVYDEVFKVDEFPNNSVNYQSDESSWFTNHKGSKEQGIYGTNLYEYESTVENIASSIIVHEWYSHWIKNCADTYKSHRLAYKNVINFSKLWANTTTNYKIFILQKLQKYTEKETGRDRVDKKYLPLYKRFIGN